MHKLTIAGPGAGKTTKMVDTILRDLPKLNPYRYMAVITYTNAATDNILRKLRSKVNVPNNLFIGTIHSFLIRFILHPYGFITNNTPQNKKYIDQAYGRMGTEEEKAEVRARATELVARGLITYDKVLELAHSILTNNHRLAEVVSYRLQFLFVDEYQDSRLYQHDIITQLMRDDNRVELVGDPLQSIYGFQYELSQLHNEPTPTNFAETPIKLLMRMDNVEVEPNRLNYRSTDNIITFLNTMSNDLQDCNKNHNSENHDIYFIDNTEPDKILECFNQLINELGILPEEGIFHKLMVGRTWGILNKFSDTTKFIEINNNQELAKSAFDDFKRIVIAILGTSIVKILGDHKISRIEFRSFILYLLFHLKSLDRTVEPLKSLLKYKAEDPFHRLIIDNWNNRFPHASKRVEDTNEIKIGASLIGCLGTNSNLENQLDGMLYSTIHGAKGLESTAVLVLAESKTWGNKIDANEYLELWLQSDKECDDDESRCGFVAFSRARKLLVISSLEPVSEENLKKLEDLKVQIIKCAQQ